MGESGAGSGSTLRARFGWRAFLLTLAILGVVTVGSGLYWRTQLLRTSGESLAAHIASIESDIELDRQTGGEPWSEGERLVLPAPETGVQVFGSSGVLVATSVDLVGEDPIVSLDQVQPGVPLEVRLDHPVFGDALARAESIDIDGTTLVVMAITSLDELNVACVGMCVLAPLAAVAIAAAVGLGVRSAVRAALAPVGELADRAAEIADSGDPEPLAVAAETAELRELSANLDHLLARIRVSFDREQQFLDDASHELRTPIAIARAELDLARRLASDEQTADSLESSLEELRRLDAMATDLLVLARERGAGTSGYVPLDLGTVAHGAAARVRQDPRQGPVVIEVTGRARIVGDPDSLERALVNLISNAARFCKEVVTISVSEAEAEVIVAVADDGPGIADHLIDNLFDRFARGRIPGAHSTGLGTAIAAAVVRRHGGTITARNRSGGGAEVTIRFPAPESPPHGTMMTGVSA